MLSYGVVFSWKVTSFHCIGNDFWYPISISIANTCTMYMYAEIRADNTYMTLWVFLRWFVSLISLCCNPSNNHNYKFSVKRSCVHFIIEIMNLIFKYQSWNWYFQIRTRREPLYWRPISAFLLVEYFAENVINKLFLRVLVQKEQVKEQFCTYLFFFLFFLIIILRPQFHLTLHIYNI